MKSFTFVLSIVWLLASCQPSTPEQSTTVFEQTISSIPTDTFQIDTAYSILTWIGSKPNRQHNGIIRFDSGAIYLKNSQPVAGQLSISIPSLQIMDLDSTKGDYHKLYRHLMSDDFFDAQNYPAGVVDMVAITPWDSTFMEGIQTEFTEASPTHMLQCNLTLRGTTQKIVLPIELSLKDNRLQLNGKIIIDRTEWGISYDNEATVVDKIKDKFIHNRVYVGFSLVAKHN